MPPAWRCGPLWAYWGLCVLLGPCPIPAYGNGSVARPHFDSKHAPDAEASSLQRHTAIDPCLWYAEELELGLRATLCWLASWLEQPVLQPVCLSVLRHSSSDSWLLQPCSCAPGPLEQRSVSRPTVCLGPADLLQLRRRKGEHKNNRRMAPKTIALFDVDGTLTAPRKVCGKRSKTTRHRRCSGRKLEPLSVLALRAEVDR